MDEKKTQPVDVQVLLHECELKIAYWQGQRDSLVRLLQLMQSPAESDKPAEA
jgi:hypothetical protein